MCGETLKFIFLPLSFGIVFCYHPPLLASYYPATYYVRPSIYPRQLASSLSFVNPASLGQSYLQTPLLCFRQPGCNLFASRNFAESNTTIPKAEDLFTPAVVQYPAESKSQLEEYKKAMEEEAKEETGNIISTESSDVGTTDVKAVTYVNVKLGGDKNVNYQYSV